MGWWDEIDEAQAVEQKAARLVNVLGRMPGDRQRKLEWLVQSIPLMEAELERDGLDPEREPRRFAGGMKSLACRWWRQEMRKAPARQSERIMERAQGERPLTDLEKAALKRQIWEQRRAMRGGG